jgi:hypothetical protein
MILMKIDAYQLSREELGDSGSEGKGGDKPL